MIDLTKIFDKLGEAAKTHGFPAVVTGLQKLDGEAKEPWQKALLKLSIDLVANHGPEGLSLLQGLVRRMLDGHAADLSGLKMSEASDLLAAMQRKGADTRNQIELYTKLILDTLGKALMDLVAVLFKEFKQ